MSRALRPVDWFRWAAFQEHHDPEVAKDLLLEFCAAYEAGEAPPPEVMAYLNRAFLEVLGLDHASKSVSADQALGLKKRHKRPKILHSLAWAEQRLPVWRTIRELERTSPWQHYTDRERYEEAARRHPGAGKWRTLGDEYTEYGRRHLAVLDAAERARSVHVMQRLCWLIPHLAGGACGGNSAAAAENGNAENAPQAAD